MARRPIPPWTGLRARFAASDPGLLRLTAGLRTATAVGLTIAVLGILGVEVIHLIVGAMAAMASAFAVTDKTVRAQAITLALGVPVALATISLGALLQGRVLARDLIFLGLIFGAVYLRRFGDRSTAFGVIGFQIYFTAMFARVTVPQLPPVFATVALAFGCSAIARFVLVPERPERVLRRLRQAFRARLAQLLAAQIRLLYARPGDRDNVLEELRRSAARLHEAALMIQGRLEAGTRDEATAALVQRRVVTAEVAAERLGLLLVGARSTQRPDPVALRLPGAATPALTAGPQDTDPVTAALDRDLVTLRLMVLRPPGSHPAAAALPARDRLLGYRDATGIPPAATPAQRDVFRAIGDLVQGVLGLWLALDPAPRETDDSPTAIRSRAEIAAENESISGAEQQAGARAPAPARLQRQTTRAAFQVTAGSALAIAGGELLSPQHWYWAVMACWVIFANTTSTGEIVVKGYRRLLGTVLGVVAGVLLATAVGQHTWVALALVLVCVFAMFFTAPLSYTLMAFFVTMGLGLLYTLLHTYSVAVLVLRIEETLLGAACGIVTAMLVLPVRTDRRTDEQLATVLRRLGDVVAASVERFSGSPVPDLLDTTRDLDTKLAQLNSSARPLTHPITPLRERRETARYVVALLETSAYHARYLATTAELTAECGHPGADPRLAGVAGRIARNIDVLVAQLSRAHDRPPIEAGPGIAALLETDSLGVPAPRTVTFRALRHLQRIDEDVIALARPLGVDVPAPS
ncbi:FUSC family protein [Nocardia sp. NEAU-G5]|uniref:FUSC family protein n=1 Tax=Nocardia albiluteola TaxID=2842303 RepID=A0ABS6B6G0_9NOCA|nr:FUSC family protein [Nocardia albiluteola]MBU3065844.1 FUSC family protein [Nocardia albiluteola]